MIHRPAASRSRVPFGWLLYPAALALVIGFGWAGLLVGQNGSFVPPPVAASTHDHANHGHGPSGHESAEGLALAAGDGRETVYAAAACDSPAPMREYRVVALNVEITLNRFLDYDPQGRMFALEEDLARVRAEEAQNREARAGRAEPAVSVGHRCLENR